MLTNQLTCYTTAAIQAVAETLLNVHLLFINLNAPLISGYQICIFKYFTSFRYINAYYQGTMKENNAKERKKFAISKIKQTFAGSYQDFWLRLKLSALAV